MVEVKLKLKNTEVKHVQLKLYHLYNFFKKKKVKKRN